ncbi:hypothetical protein K493DRAFT_275415 [Basidiobolus meristosporus CBS 931.73]|uniref:LrgB-domain-containing protein n=1 Tax=Basidiobolus meristosporus CBS 931.73 TaxID=1314790 RepID=A0A1Y1Z434_9FUNG|nr:hypothetical protein K493DRAFT_275415 [Basidiobolus meristosporus CBS 931.73]|eukprot:ORY05010.1 hypothetical protein K493DRAFT_275415 [Basidiobolus meristosporus CBS 931.73]
MNQIIVLTPIEFPASVACMILTFIFLLVFNLITSHYTQKFIRAFSPAVDFLLKWINVLFCPAFILIPKSKPISPREFGVVLALFVIGLLVSAIATALTVNAFKKLKCYLFKQHTLQPSDEPKVARIDLDEDSVIDVADDDSTLNGVLDVCEPISNEKSHHHMDELVKFLGDYANPIIYFTLFIPSFIAYLVTDQALPVQLTLNVLCFYAALAVPTRIRRFLHPIITCSGLMIFFIFILQLIKGRTLDQGLNEFSTGTRYLVLLDPKRRDPVSQPGAGDVLYSLLDGSIVSLSFNMFKYRRELREHAFEMIPTISIISVASLFLYPLIAGAIQIPSDITLPFAVRGITTPLALNIEAVLGGDVNTTVIMVIVTGILGAVGGQWFVQKLGFGKDDYITIGVTLGCNANAVSTAALLETNLKAAAIASLSFVLFGTIPIILVAIPPITNTIRGFAI